MKRNRGAGADTADVTQMPVPVAGPGAELTAILTSCNERLRFLEQQATDIVFAEVGLIQEAWLRAIDAATHLTPQQQEDRDNLARMIEVVGGWFDTVAQTQNALVALLGKTALNRPAGSGGQTHGAGLLERRKSAVVINFPDRRRAA